MSLFHHVVSEGELKPKCLQLLHFLITDTDEVINFGRSSKITCKITMDENLFIKKGWSARRTSVIAKH